jgi:hypothetical protein
MLVARVALFAMLMGSVMVAHSQPDWPPIMGKLTGTSYVNAELGFEFLLPQAPCTQIDEEKAVAFSTTFKRRIQLGLSCDDETVILSAMPFRPEEKLKSSFEASVGGVVDGGGFNRKDKPEQVKVDGLPVMIQGLAREQQMGFYLGGVSHRKFWIDIVIVGPQEKRDQMRKALNELKFPPA